MTIRRAQLLLKTWTLTSLGIALGATQLAQAQLLRDPLESGTNWTVAQEPVDPDSVALFGYDYSQVGIPEAPNSNVAGGDLPTSGLRMEVNNGDTFAFEEELYVFSNQSFTGQYTVKADIWINYGIGAAGSTQYAGVSVGADGMFTEPSDVSGNTLDRAMGATLIYTGDGGASRDYRLYKGGIRTDTQVFAVGEQFIESGQYSGDNGDLPLETTPIYANNNSHPTLAEAFPAIDASTIPTQGQSGSGLAGAGGLQWMTMTVEVDPEGLASQANPEQPGFARFYLTSAASGETLQIGTVINSNGNATDVPYEGKVALMMADLFSSIADPANLHFAIFDNILVTEGIGGEVEPLADFNGDLVVDAADYTVWRNNLGLGDGTPGSLDVSDGDANGDGVVNGDDYLVWKDQFGDVLTPGAALTASSVPEPASAVMILVALAGSGLACRLRGTRTPPA